MSASKYAQRKEAEADQDVYAVGTKVTVERVDGDEVKVDDGVVVMAIHHLGAQASEYDVRLDDESRIRVTPSEITSRD